MKPKRFTVVLADEEGNVIESWTDCVTEQNTPADLDTDTDTFPSWDELNRAAERHENKQ